MQVFGISFEDAYPEVKGKVVLIGPEKAKRLLELNVSNRRPSEAVVNKYVDEINADEWVVTSAGIGISEEGKLIDGQQRLMAIVRSGKTVPCLIVIGLPNRAQLKLDRQRRRNLADSLTLAGTECKRSAMEIANTIVWINGKVTSDTEIIQTYQTHLEAIQAVEAAKIVRKRMFVGVRAAIALCYEVHGDVALDFYRAIQSDLHSRKDDPAYRLWAWLLTMKGGGYAQLRQMFHRTIFAFNAWVQKRYISCLRECSEIVSVSLAKRTPEKATRNQAA